MTPSAKCEDLVRKFEGERLFVYADPGTGGAPWTAGVGHTGADVRPGMRVTRAQSDAWLRADLAKAAQATARLIGDRPTTQAQFDALVSFTFNVGAGHLAGSTLLRLHRAGDHAGAAAQFAAWNKAGGRVLPGLTRRRAAEAALYAG